MSEHGPENGRLPGRLWPIVLALLTGVLTGCSLASLPERILSWLPWIALAPLCWALWILPLPGRADHRTRHCFLLGWISGTAGFLISLFWITTVTVAGWVALCAILGIYHALWGLFAGIVLRPLGAGADPSRAWLGSIRNLLVALLAAAAWTALEWLRGTLFSGFGWNSLGVALGRNIPLSQIVSVTGTSGLTFLCVLSAAIAAITIQRLRREIRTGRPRPHFDFFAVVFLIVLVFSHGVRILTAPRIPTMPLRVAGLQGNIPVYDYWDKGKEEEILARYLRLSREGLRGDPDLLVWPEAATPRPLLLDEMTWGSVKELAQRARADFLIGSIHYEANPKGDYNSAILVTGHASASEIYNKVHLVPFGEFVPFRKSFPLIAWIERKEVPYDFDPGKGPALLEMASRPVKLGPLICFEDTLGDQTRRTAALGAQLLVTLTNDGWFEHSAGTRQHLANARLRTIETGLPLLRVADTGITCVIDRFGRTLEELHGPGGDTFVEGILKAEIAVPVMPVPTFYTLHGDLFAHVCLGLAVAVTAAACAASLLGSLRLHRPRG
jgi:apolipoprotein N-acyltransferase